jgi:glycosyltransferase involved in cell wall biosynthesis
MDLLIDGQALQTPSSACRGIGRYARNLIRALSIARPSWNITVVQNDRLPPIEAHALRGLPLLSFRPPFALEEKNAEANELCYGDWLRAQHPGCVLISSAFEREGVMPWFVGSRPALACVLYDLIPLVFPERYLADPAALASYARHLRRLAAADLVLSDSEASARDFRRFLPEAHGNLINIRGATDSAFAPLSKDKLATAIAALGRRIRLEREFLLYVGGDDFRKNVSGALHTFAALPAACRSRYDLAIVCHLPDAARARLEETARQLGITEHLKLVGYVTDVELTALYQICRLFLFPSLYEGLGLPVLEALCCGAPVVASSLSAVPEYAGPVSWLADPYSPEAFARSVEEALAEPRDLRRAERIAFAQTFTWERSAALACQALDRLARKANRLRTGTPSRRRRIAFVSPLPPSHTGIADYAGELLEPLAEHFDIELVVDPQQPKLANALLARHRVLEANELGRRHAALPFDLFVYQLGNSHYHHYMLSLMSRFRGLVVLHDYYLAGMLTAARQVKRWPYSLEQDLEYEGETQMVDWVRHCNFPGWAVDCLLPLNRRVLELAAGVVVHSGWSWQRLRRWVDVPVYQVPQAMPVPQLGSQQEERRRLGLPADAFLICTLGQLVHPKRVEILIGALARLPEALRAQTRLLLVGEGSPELRALLQRLAEDLGVGAMIHYLGRVALADLSAYARASDVCVQLRYPTHGETSASLLRALAAGTACITSDQGPMAEVPANVAWKVRAPQHELDDLVAALCSLHADPETRRQLGETGRRYIREQHALERVATQFSAVIEQALARRAARDEDWQDLAANALADCGALAIAESSIDTWLRMRRQGQPELSHGAQAPQLSQSPRFLRYDSWAA